MRRLILSCTSAALIFWGWLSASAEGATCLIRDVGPKQTIDSPDFSHVDLAPGHNRARSEQLVSWWQDRCPHLVEQPVPRFRLGNHVCRIEGRSQDTLVVGAHYDKVSIGWGVADNWSGIVLLDALMNRYREETPNYSIEFVAFAAEEEGLYGAKAYIQQTDHSMVGMVNLDTIGLRELIVSSKSDPKLICLTKSIADNLGMELTERKWKKLGGDWEVFDKKGIPAVNLHSVDRTTIRRIHHRRDKPGNVDLSKLAAAYKLADQLVSQLVY